MGSTILFFHLLCLTFPHYIYHRPVNFVAGDLDLIQKTCKSTKYYDLCVSSLKSNATSTSADTEGLAVIMMGVGMADATASSTYFASQLIRTTNDTTLKKVLKECADKYSYAGDALRASVEDLAVKTYDYAYMHVLAAKDYPNACHTAFRRYPGLAYLPEIACREDGLKHICDVILGIFDLLGW